MRKRIGAIILGCQFILTPLAVAANEMDAVDDRVYKLEKSTENRSPVLPMDASKFRLGGFLTSTHTTLIKPDDEDEGTFNTNRFELLIGLDLSENLEFFTAFGIISQSLLQNKDSVDRTYSTKGGDPAQGNRDNPVPLIISHGTWKWNRYANLKFGRFVAPIGIINIEHFPPGLFLESPPQFLRAPVPGGVFWDHFLNGVDFFGTLGLGGSKLEYHFNYSTFSFMPAPRPLAGFPTQEILGGRLAFTFLNDHITLGTSYQAGERIRAFANTGVDLLVNWGGFNLKVESVSSKEEELEDSDPQVMNPTDKTGMYVQPSYAVLDNVRLVFRYDVYDSNIDDDADQFITENVFGVNWLPDPLLRLRAEYKDVKYEENENEAGDNINYQEVITSAVLSF